jgi:hypothetical protein
MKLVIARSDASRSLSSGAHSRDPLARNDERTQSFLNTTDANQPVINAMTAVTRP